MVLVLRKLILSVIRNDNTYLYTTGIRRLCSLALWCFLLFVYNRHPAFVFACFMVFFIVCIQPASGVCVRLLYDVFLLWRGRQGDTRY